MTKAEREQAKKNAAVSVIADILVDLKWAVYDAKSDVYPLDQAESRERARLYRIALRAVREEVRRGK